MALHDKFIPLLERIKEVFIKSNNRSLSSQSYVDLKNQLIKSNNRSSSSQNYDNLKNQFRSNIKHSSQAFKININILLSVKFYERLRQNSSISSKLRKENVYVGGNYTCKQKEHNRRGVNQSHAGKYHHQWNPKGSHHSSSRSHLHHPGFITVL